MLPTARQSGATLMRGFQMVAAVLSLSAFASSTDKVEEVERLLTFGPPASSSTTSSTAAPYRVRVGETEFRVLSAVPFLDYPEARTIAVIDLAGTEPACRVPLLRDATEWWKRQELTKWPDVRVILGQNDGSGLEAINWGTTERYLFLSPGESRNEGSCGSKKSRWQPSWWEMQLSVQGFRGLVDEIRNPGAPVRILWIGQSFGWFEAVINAATAPTDESILPDFPRFSPNAAFWRLERIAAAGVSLSTAAWSLSQATSASVDHRAAQRVAGFLGGRTFDCIGKMARCAGDIDRATALLTVLRISGPPVLRRWGLHPRTIEIVSPQMNSGRDGEGMSRPFSTDPKGLTWSSMYEQGVPPRKLLQRGEIRDAPGCCGENTDASSVCLAIPRGLVGDSLQVLIRPLETADPVHRSWRSRGSARKVLPTGYVSIDLSDVPAVVRSVEVLLFDTRSRWAATVRVGRPR